MSTSNPLKAEKKHHLQGFGGNILTILLAFVLISIIIVVLYFAVLVNSVNDIVTVRGNSCFYGLCFSNSGPLALIFMTAMAQISEMRDVNNLFKTVADLISF